MPIIGIKGRKDEKGVGRPETGGAGERTIEAGTGFPRFHSTFEIIRAIDKGEFSQPAMFTFHPQRWNHSIGPWVKPFGRAHGKELVWKNVKNGVKWLMVKNG
ncbi:MAG: hypothetical protein GWP15_03080 [Nitrospirae bacterium]|nr:hypothetical protein [Nitrospirota bacterium]